MRPRALREGTEVKGPGRVRLVGNLTLESNAGHIGAFSVDSEMREPRQLPLTPISPPN